MGTRADFYVGTGQDAEWIGSISYDGYPDGSPADAIEATNEASYRAAVEVLLADPEVLSTRPSDGWPWPWHNSHTSDYAYTWLDGAPRVTTGERWETLAEYNARHERDDGMELSGRVEFPDMSERKADAAVVVAKSGLIFLR